MAIGRSELGQQKTLQYLEALSYKYTLWSISIRCQLPALLVRPNGCAAHRERRREGMRCLWVELHEAELDVLVRKGLLEPQLRHDENAIADALYAHLERTLTPTPT